MMEISFSGCIENVEVVVMMFLKPTSTVRGEDQAEVYHASRQNARV